MTLRYIADGWSASTKRPGLAGLLFAGNLLLGIILAIPILTAFSAAVSDSGFSPELAEEFDVALWADVMQDAGPVFQTLLQQLFWALPLLYLWKVGSAVGVVHALRGDAKGSFWEGVGSYSGRALLLGLPFVGMAGLIVLGVILVATVLSLTVGGEVMQFWLFMVFTPLLLVLALAVLDMMHDFARLELIEQDRPVMAAWWTGIGWFFRSGTAHTIYIGWFVIGSVALFIPFWADLAMGGILIAFIVQQVLLYVRALITVGWLGSELRFFEAQHSETSDLEPVQATAP